MVTIVHRFFLFCLLIFFSVPAYAQPAPPPISMGSFFVTPKLTLEQQYDTNILAENNSGKDDFITIINPSLTVEKSVRDHQFILEGESEIQRFASESSENIENYFAGFKGHLTALKTLKLPFNISYDINHKERRRERTLTSSTEPLKFKTFKTEIGAEFQPNRLMTGIYAQYETRRYDNGVTSAGAPVIREDGDYDAYGAKLALTYETGTEWQPFASLTVRQEDFLRRSYNGTSFTGASRDNTLYRALAGLSFQYKGLLSGNIALGKDWRHYEDNSISDISALGAEANLQWNPTAGTQIEFNLSRFTDEDNEINTGIVETKGGIAMNYELQSDIFLRAGTEYENADFETSSREDDYYSGNIGVYYALSPRLQIGAGFTQRVRDSSQTGASFDQSVFGIRLVGAL